MGCVRWVAQRNLRPFRSSSTAAHFMTRCLDCGSERTTDQCPSCGLTTAAAELMFRRRLMRQTGIFLLGSLAFPYISQIYPPLDLVLILGLFGLICFGALT